VTLWSHALTVTDRNFVAQDNLGQALITQGKLTEAMQHFQAAANIDPTDPAAQMGIGVLQLRQGDRISSIEHFQNVLRLTSSPRLRAYAMTNLGSTYRQLRDYQRARENYEGALNVQPDTVIAVLGLGLISDKTGEPVRAADYYSRAVALEPSDVAYLLLARALERSGRNDEALSARQQAQRLSGNFDQTNELVNKLLAE
jgi:protein O-mannosyl-transferase